MVGRFTTNGDDRDTIDPNTRQNKQRVSSVAWYETVTNLLHPKIECGTILRQVLSEIVWNILWIDDEIKTAWNSPRSISEDPAYKSQLNQVAYDHEPGPITWSHFNPDQQLGVH